MKRLEFEALIAAARDALALPELEISVSPNWKSDKSIGPRQLLRESLAEKLKALSPTVDSSSVRDLAHLPHHPNYSISISHCRALGGFALIPKPHAIGFDIEEIHRVKETVAERIGNAKDAKPPTPAHLWAAKEALFKCLVVGQQPEIIASLAVHSWTLSAPGIYTFRAARIDSAPDPRGYGVAFKTDQLIYSVFAQPSLN